MSQYFGSVRFFKNLILLTVIILIIVPTVFAIRLAVRTKQDAVQTEELRGQVRSVKEQLAQQTAETDEARGQTDALAAQLEAMRQQEEEQAALEAEKIAYQQLYPDFYAPQPLDASRTAKDVVYLTFDDGPSARTDEILDILEKADVKATFFVVGQTQEEQLARMKAITDAGHTLGMHSYSHKYTKIYQSVASYLEDMYELFCQIREVTGTTPTVFRFPGGSINSYNTAVYQEIIAEMLRRGFVPYDWNMSSEDAAASPPAADIILNNIVTSAEGRNRCLILFHDSVYKYTTVAALPAVIDALKEQGYTFAPLTPDVRPVLFAYPD